MRVGGGDAEDPVTKRIADLLLVVVSLWLLVMLMDIVVTVVLTKVCIAHGKLSPLSTGRRGHPLQQM